jgi:hypothetical protein
MPLIAWMLLLAASSSVELVDQTYLIPPNDWRFVDLGLKQRPAMIRAAFEVESGPPVQLILMERADLERLNRGEAHSVVAVSQTKPKGRLEVRTGRPGDYVIVVENHSGQPEAAKVRLRVAIDFVEATELSPQCQLTVIYISFGVFFGIVTYSARRLWQAVRS